MKLCNRVQGRAWVTYYLAHYYPSIFLLTVITPRAGVRPLALVAPASYASTGKPEKRFPSRTAPVLLKIYLPSHRCSASGTSLLVMWVAYQYFFASTRILSTRSPGTFYDGVRGQTDGYQHPYEGEELYPNTRRTRPYYISTTLSHPSSCPPSFPSYPTASLLIFLLTLPLSPSPSSPQPSYHPIFQASLDFDFSITVWKLLAEEPLTLTDISLVDARLGSVLTALRDYRPPPPPLQSHPVTSNSGSSSNSTAGVASRGQASFDAGFSVPTSAAASSTSRRDSSAGGHINSNDGSGGDAGAPSLSPAALARHTEESFSSAFGPLFFAMPMAASVPGTLHGASSSHEGGGSGE